MLSCIKVICVYFEKEFLSKPDWSFTKYIVIKRSHYHPARYAMVVFFTDPKFLFKLALNVLWWQTSMSMIDLWEFFASVLFVHRFYLWYILFCWCSAILDTPTHWKLRGYGTKETFGWNILRFMSLYDSSIGYFFVLLLK